jgi:hypothetical protein
MAQTVANFERDRVKADLIAMGTRHARVRSPVAGMCFRQWARMCLPLSGQKLLGVGERS